MEILALNIKLLAILFTCIFAVRAIVFTKVPDNPLNPILNCPPEELRGHTKITSDYWIKISLENMVGSNWSHILNRDATITHRGSHCLLFYGDYPKKELAMMDQIYMHTGLVITLVIFDCLQTFFLPSEAKSVMFGYASTLICLGCILSIFISFAKDFRKASTSLFSLDI